MKEGENMSKEIKFSQLSKEWLELKKISIKYSTYIKYNNIIELYLIDFYQDICLQECDEMVHLDLFESLKNDKELSASTLKSITFILKNILEYGEEKYNLKHVNLWYLKVNDSKKQIKVLSKQDKEELTKYCKSNINQTTLAIYISLYTGLRLGEICGLKWEDVDIDNSLIFLLRTVQRIKSNDKSSKTKKMVFEPKTQASKRVVVLTDFLVEYINDYRKLYGIDKTNSAFYLLSNSLDIPEPRNIQRNFKNLCELLKLKMNFHCLRHTFATNCIKYGIDVKTVSELLGHSSVTTTLNLYVHPSLEYKKEQINKIPK